MTEPATPMSEATTPMSEAATPAAGKRVLLDNRRTPCAVGLIKAARTMAELAPGTILEIWSKDRFAPMEVPIWAERDGHSVRELGMQGRWPARHYVFEVTKGGAGPT